MADRAILVTSSIIIAATIVASLVMGDRGTSTRSDPA
jgi:hypothetical protein